ncbi:NAD(P)(+)--arginine ADP-ribosyltransferase 2-like [Garra rufa]|uniref:NAD(P)(+)--arginine ADP-ribosyltransferase 2-like n=1 Tax=Garra rufa TaxID=137080 RepID=UPI003CCEF148
MALKSVDDEYDGCTVNMANLVKTKYLEMEINDSDDFKKAWQEGEVNATAPEDNLTSNHSVAIYVYTNLKSNVYRTFNMAVCNGKQNYADQTFKWYSLHFFLTDAIKKLTETQKKCYLTFRGTKAEFDKNVLNKEIRFGSFASSSLDRNMAQRLGNKSCFEIKTCKGADVTKYSKYPKQKQVLIPPYEKFKVTAVMTRSNHSNLWCETVFKLESSGTRSNMNCTVAFKKTEWFNNNTSGIKVLKFSKCIAKQLSNGREINSTDEELVLEFLEMVEWPALEQLSRAEKLIRIAWAIGQKKRCHDFLYVMPFYPYFMELMELIKPCC